MKFRIFPEYSARERETETKATIATCAFFAVVSVIGLGLFFYGGEVPPTGSSFWSTIRWGALLVGAISAFCTIQSLFDVMIAATVGPERAIAMIIVVTFGGAVFAWLAY
ncbi:hypothetical protein [Phyllobacterium sp. SB3]|uniref:hypothetical protein n=1 Tax=Phyllobacterium sp. SB3 TaxID=3156073 RepID=UPI0032AF0F2C